MYRRVLSAIFIFFLLQSVVCLAVDSQNAETERNLGIASSNIADAAKKLSAGNSLKVSMNWGQNPEVKKLRSFSAAKRVAVIYNVINFLEKNDEIIFDKAKTNDYQLAASILTRLSALSYLGELVVVGSTENEEIIRDYIYGEVSDLKLVLASRVPYGAYRSSRKMRDDKRSMLLHTDRGFVEERAKIEVAVSRLKCKKCSMMLPKIKCVWSEQLSRAFEP